MMRLYLETARIDQVRELDRWGCFAGVSTSSTSIGDTGLELQEALNALADAQHGDVLVEIDEESPDTTEANIRELCSLVPSRLMILLRATPIGLEVMHRLKDERIWTAAASLVSFGPALLAANAGADVLIPSFSKMGHRGNEPDQTIREMIEMCRHRGGRPRVLVANLEDLRDVRTVAGLGAWGATLPVELAFELLESGSTSSFLEGRGGDLTPKTSDG